MTIKTKSEGNDSTQSLYEREMSNPKFRRGYIKMLLDDIYKLQKKYEREKNRLDYILKHSVSVSRTEIDEVESLRKEIEEMKK